MKIKYLGTAAYEGIPSLFCDCRVCRQSRKKGGKNLRTRTQALIDDCILIDFNPDTLCHYQKYNFDWNKIEACLITHSHSDHLYLDDIEIARDGYSYGHGRINFFAAKDGYEKILPYVALTKNGISDTEIEAGKEFSVADGKYSVLPLKANHDPKSSPVIFAIKSADKKMLYANDTGFFYDETLLDLLKFAPFDLISLDCTQAITKSVEYVNEHMGIKTDTRLVELLRERGIIDERTIIVLNHFSHNGCGTYDEIKEEADKLGFIVAYDGLEIEF